VADDTAFRPKTTSTDGRNTNTFSGATTDSNSSTTASNSQAVTVPTVRLICFVMTHDGYHDTRVEAVRKTWGSRCDSLIIASNATDTSMGTIAMNSEATYTGLWEKLNETMQYIYETYHPHRHSQNDNPSHTRKNNNGTTQQLYEEWILKADDDSYFIIENLRAFLASQQVQALHNPATTATEYGRNNDTSYKGKTIQKVNRKTARGTPLIYGRIYSAPRYKHLANRSVYFRNPVNFDFKSRFYAKMKPLEPVL
jgi:Fringe-like